MYKLSITKVTVKFMRRNEKRTLREGSMREAYMSYMDVNLTNYTGVREKKADSRKDQTAAEAQRAEKERLAV